MWNIRDYANVLELSLISNLESFNSEFIKQWLSKEKRYEMLSKIAEEQEKINDKNFWTEKDLKFKNN